MAGIIEHGTSFCRGCGFRPEAQGIRRQGECGFAYYILVLQSVPEMLYAWTPIEREERRHIHAAGLNPVQAMYYLRMPTPI